jgi:hypothetical protein
LLKRQEEAEAVVSSGAGGQGRATRSTSPQNQQC